MKKYSTLIQNFFIVVIVSVFFVYGCTGVKNGQKTEQLPSVPVEEKVEQSKKVETLSGQPTQEPPPRPAPPTASPPVLEPPKTSRPSILLTPPPPLRTTKILWDSVNLREGPGLNSRVTGNVKKGTSLSILEDKGNWLRVQLEDGSQAWVTKAATSEAPKPIPSPPPKPKPM